ncbi:MAG TPA: hypothetical protein VFH95_03770 [Candidatus Kapabacteria bacterium]|nr:hypothetical protein [Candidatus Kapabacteria bacterium]
MQKLGISLLFFMLAVASFFLTSPIFAQAPKEFLWQGIIPDSLLHFGDSIVAHGIIPEGKLKDLRNFKLPSLSNSPSRRYFSKNGERYYIDILPPEQKGKRVDSSDVWLLRAK